MKNKRQKIIKVRRKVLPDGTHQKTSVGVTNGGRLCVTEQKSKKLNKKGDYSVSTTKTYRQPTEASLKNLSKHGVKVRVVNKGTAKKTSTTAKRKTAPKKPAVKRTTAKSRSSKSKRK